MNLGECIRCGAGVRVGGRGRPQRYCSSACRQAAYRDRRVPIEMQGVRWVRAMGKRPVRPDGSPASSTDRRTWSPHGAVRTGAGDGFGVMLGDGLGCYDLDHVTVAEVRRFVASIPERVLLVERSVSGTGAHVFIAAPESPGWRRTIDGISVERYTRSRFIRTTLDRFAL